MVTSTRTSKADTLIASVVTQLIDAIEAGTERWEMPWQRLGPDVMAPTNAATGRRYRGGNRWSLALAAMTHGLAGGSWATYRQWQDLGAQVRKGEKALAAVLVPREHHRSETDDETGEETTRIWIDFRAAVVFHASQVDGWQPASTEVADHAPLTDAEALLAIWQGAGMVVIESGDSAYYNRRDDTVHLPARSQFGDIEHFYSTAAHEATHWTGAPARLDRHAEIRRFGDDAYAAEELVAELGAAVIGAEFGISHATRDDHAAYLAHWVRILRQEPRHLWTVAGAAETAAAYLLELGAHR